MGADSASRLPGYQLIARIGSGTYGEVWKGRALVSQTDCAIKLVGSLKGPNDPAVLRELEGLRNYSRICLENDALLKVLHSDMLPDGSGFFYVMELADRDEAGSENSASYTPKTLQTEMRRRKRLPVLEVLRIGISLCNCLKQLHNCGLVHGDIKPSSVLYVGEHIKLGDIGLVNTPANVQPSLGTIGFFPSEDPGTIESDLYALGKVLFCAVTGLDRTMYPRLPDGWDKSPDRTAFLELNRVMAVACANHKKDRYHSASELLSDLTQIENGTSFRLLTIRRKLHRLQVFFVAVLVCAVVLWIKNVYLRSANSAERRRVVSLEVAQGMRLADQGDISLALNHFVAAARADENPHNKAVHDVRIECALAESPTLANVWFGEDGVREIAWDGSKSRFAFASRSGSVQFVDLEKKNQEAIPILDAGRLTSVRLTKDARFIAVASGEHYEHGVVQIFAVASGQPVGPRLSTASFVRRLAFAPNDRDLAIACDDGSARVWNGWSGALISPIVHHDAQIRATEFGSAANTILTAGWDGSARIWNYTTGMEACSRMLHDGYIRYAEFSPDGTKVATCGDDGYVKIWDSKDGRLVTEPIFVGSRCMFVTFRPDSQAVVVASADGTARVYNTHNGRLYGAPVRHKNSVTYAAFSKEGDRIVTASNDRTARVWEVATGAPLSPPLRHSDEVTTAWFTSGDSVITTSSDGTVKLWRLGLWGKPHPESSTRDQRFSAIAVNKQLVAAESASHEISIHRFNSKNQIAGPFHPGSGIVTAQFSPAASTLLVTTVSSELQLWALQSNIIPPRVAHHSTISEDRLVACWNGDGSLCATGGRDKTAQVWKADTLEPLGPRLPHSGSVGYVAFSQQGRYLCTATYDTYGEGRTNASEAVIWDSRTFKRVSAFKHPSVIYQLSIDPRENVAITVSADHTAQIWAFPSGVRKSSPLLHANSVISAEFSPDGRRVATASTDYTVRVWDTESGDSIGRPMCHEGTVRCLLFSKEGSVLITGSEDHTVRLWNPETGEPISQPLIHTSAITGVRYSDDQKTLYTSSRTELLRSWSLSRLQPSPIDLAVEAQLLTAETIYSSGLTRTLLGKELWDLWKIRPLSSH